jgi:GTPase Era involved in 16S rRNA processing
VITSFQVDLLSPKANLAEITEMYKKIYPRFDDVFYISALQRRTSRLSEHLMSLCRPGEWRFPPGWVGYATPVEIACEILREKLYLRYHKELPYTTTVVRVSVLVCLVLAFLWSREY